MRILFASTSTNQPTGYGKISYIILTHLASIGHEIYHFSFQNYKKWDVAGERDLPQNVHVIDVHEKSDKTFGHDIWNETVTNVSPDLIIVYNDMPVTCSLINEMVKIEKKCPFISYLDIVYEFQREALVERITSYADHIFVFSEFWKDHLMKGYGISPRDITVFSHGINHRKFVRADLEISKEQIGCEKDDFIVFNTNRNSYRKLWDITIKAFIRFLKMTNNDPKVKLLINCCMGNAEGYNFHDMIKTACISENVDKEEVSNHNILLLTSDKGGYVSDAILNIAFNASDIGINTAGGEGFGLCSAEGGFLGKPQIVTNTGGLADIFKGFENMLVEPKIFMSLPSGIDYHGGELALCDYRDFADRMFFYYKNKDIMKKDGEKLSESINSRYDWDILLRDFSLKIEKIAHEFSKKQRITK